MRMLSLIHILIGEISRAHRENGAKYKDCAVLYRTNAQSRLFEEKLSLIHIFYGRHNMERQMERTHLGHGNWSVGSIRGTSSHHHNPFVILCDRNTEETYGDCYGYALAYLSLIHI